MDNKSLADIIAKIPSLKYKFLGSYPANQYPNLVQNSFLIINTDPQESVGAHWIMLANKNGRMYYGDSLGEPLDTYQHIRKPKQNIDTVLVTHRIQTTEALCGLYCIYFAWNVFNHGNSKIFSFNDLDLLQFIHKYL